MEHVIGYVAFSSLLHVLFMHQVTLDQLCIQALQLSDYEACNSDMTACHSKMIITLKWSILNKNEFPDSLNDE